MMSPIRHSALLKRLGKAEYELQAHGWEFHVRKEGSRWVLTAFDSSIEDADRAYIDSTEHKTLREAVEYAVAPTSGA